MDTRIFKEKVKKVHGTTYQYSRSDLHNITSYRSEIRIKCSTHGVFKQRVSNHLQGKGCIECGYLRSNLAKCIDTKEFIKRAIKKHGDTYSYKLTDYKDSQSKVTIICRTHGAFEQKANNHLQGKGCSKCRDDKHKKKLQSEAKVQAAKLELELKNIRPDIKIFRVLTDRNRSAIAECSKHGKYKRSAHQLLKGKDCPMCGYENIHKKQALGKDLFIERVSKFNSNLSFDKLIYTSAHKKVTITCNKHGDFKKVPMSMMHGAGCPKCSKNLFSVNINKKDFYVRSNNEKMALYYIMKKGIPESKIYDGYSYEIPTIILQDGYKHTPDFYIPAKNILIEVKGVDSFGIFKFHDWNLDNLIRLNQQKCLAAQKLGYTYILMIMYKHKRLKLPENWTLLKPRKLRHIFISMNKIKHWKRSKSICS